MPFEGEPVIKQVSDRIIRITGVAIAPGITGSIGLFGATGSAPDLRLPESFKPDHYTYANQVVDLSDQIQVSYEFGFDSSVGGLTVQKNGSHETDFRMTLKNPDLENHTPPIEIYIKIHD